MKTKSVEPKQETPRETPYMRLKKAKQERGYWYGRARMDTASLSRTLRRVAEIEEICAQLEREIAEGKK